jgi:hypothetical protein
MTFSNEGDIAYIMRSMATLSSYLEVKELPRDPFQLEAFARLPETPRHYQRGRLTVSWAQGCLSIRSLTINYWRLASRP